MSRLRTLRVVHQIGDEQTDLGTLQDDFLHASSLDPFVSKLLQDGVTLGTIALVDQETGVTITKRSLEPVRSGATRTKYETVRRFWFRHSRTKPVR